MADPSPTTGDLLKAKAITADDVDVLIKAYGDNLGAGRLPLGDGYRLDVDKAIDAHPQAAKALADPASSEGWRRTAIRTAILLARPEKA